MSLVQLFNEASECPIFIILGSRCRWLADGVNWLRALESMVMKKVKIKI